MNQEASVPNIWVMFRVAPPFIGIKNSLSSSEVIRAPLLSFAQ